MRFILIAPMTESGGSPGVTWNKKQGQIKRHELETQLEASDIHLFSNREKSYAVLNHQTWAKVAQVHPTDTHNYILDEAWIVNSRNLISLVLVVSTHQDYQPPTTEELETELSDFAIMVADNLQELTEYEVAWVSRTQLLMAKETVTEGWMELDEMDRINSISFTHEDEGGFFNIGWGNNSLKIPATSGMDSPLSIKPVFSLIEGLVDAQFLWLELDWISKQSSSLLLKTLSFSNKRVNRQMLGWLSSETSGLSSLMAGHRLGVDELRFRNQGLRKRVGIKALETWGYDATEPRVEKRLDDLESAVSNWRGGLNNRFQAIVEFIMVIFTLFTSIGLALSFISTANIGTTGGPGTENGWGILTWFRDTDSDIVLLMSAAMIFVVALTILITRLLNFSRIQRMEKS